jgi:hypothetical protein
MFETTSARTSGDGSARHRRERGGWVVRGTGGRAPRRLGGGRLDGRLWNDDRVAKPSTSQSDQVEHVELAAIEVAA